MNNYPINRIQILDSSKLKKFADDNFRFDENGRKFSKWVENTVGKGEIARYEQFLLFPECFQKACFSGASKGVLVWERDTGLGLDCSWSGLPGYFSSLKVVLQILGRKFYQNTKKIKVLIVLKARKLRIRDNTRGRTRSLETFDLMKGHIGYYEVSFD